MKTEDNDSLMESQIKELEQLRKRVKELENIEAENKIILQELAFEKDLLYSLMNNIPDTIYFKDRESRFVRVNKAQAQILGLSNPEEAIGKSDFDFFTKKHASEAFQDEQNILKTGKALIAKVEKIRRADGQYRYVSATKVPITDFRGKYIGIVGISRDVTEVIKAEDKIKKYSEELAKSNSSKDKFFSIIAHDLKSPFTSLLGIADFLSSHIDELAVEEIKILSESICKSANGVFRLLENLLQWARLQTGRLKFQPENLVLNDIIRSVGELYQDQIIKKEITLENRIPEELSVFADKNMTAAVVRNLISNAVKFTKPGGRISLLSVLQNDMVHVSVCDEGIGIPEDVKEKLFRIDECVSTEGTANEKGTGLGLVLSKEFVEKNGGTIGVESIPGQGSEFTFSLKAARD
ncbi:MAG TPA: PAS domain-containing sensor histidine kinase [Ignavibacteriales bacterium]|nr:PAS domain-containing sensor histidine kinase [Ignavibacteriales bacterium]